MLDLDGHDRELVEKAVGAIREAVAAHLRAGVAKRIAVVAMRHRNVGRAAAIKRHPFSGVCEQSGLTLLRHDAVLDECEPEKGYLGQVRWVATRQTTAARGPAVAAEVLPNIALQSDDHLPRCARSVARR